MAWYNEKFECPNPPDCAANQMVPPSEWNAMVAYLKDKIRGMPFTVPSAGDDGKYIKYVHSTPGFVLDTPAGGGDMLKSVYDIGDNGIVDNSEKVDGCDAGIATGNVFKIPAGIAQGDIFYVNASGNIVRLAAGTNGHFLKTQGAAANPIWAAGASGSTTWLALTDTPGAFDNGKIVKSGAAALSFGMLESDIFKKDGSVAMTWDIDMAASDVKNCYRLIANNDNGFLTLHGGATLGSNSYIRLYGKDATGNLGKITFEIVNAAKTGLVMGGYFSGATDTPKLRLEHGLIVDVIAEKTAAAGVTIDTCLIKDGKAANSDKVGGKQLADLLEVAAGDFNAFTEKVSPANADIVLIEDSAASYAKKKVQVGNLPGGGGSSTWLGLTDTPGAFTGQAGKYPKVNAGETALEFGTPSGGGDVVGPASSVNSRIVLFDGVTGKLIKDAGKLLSNTANNIPVLDASADLPLAQIPATLTGKDADSVDGCDAGIATGNVFKIPTIVGGDIFYVSGTNTIVKLAAGTSGHFLKTQGSGVSPVWAAGAGGVNTWLELTDTPGAFDNGKIVKSGAAALSFGMLESDIFKKDGSIAMTGALDMGGNDIKAYLIYRSGLTSFLDLYGGDNYSANITLFGESQGIFPGYMKFQVPNAAKSAWLNAFEITGATNTPIPRFYYPIEVDTINEKTAAAGVTVDTCLIKDGKVADSNKLEGSTKTQVQTHAPASHGADKHTDRTREISLLVNAAYTTATLSIQTNYPVAHLEDAITKSVYFATKLPSDLVTLDDIQFIGLDVVATGSDIRVLMEVKGGTHNTSASTINETDTMTKTLVEGTVHRIDIQSVKGTMDLSGFTKNHAISIKIARLGGDGADDYEDTFKLIGLILKYTADM